MSDSEVATQEPLDPAVWRVAAVVFIGPFLTQIDSTVVNISLSSIGQALHAPLVSTQWVVTAYLLALALTLPLNGWVVDRFGAKRLYLVCFAAFTAASLLCGLSENITQLICARALQGVCGGLLVPMAQMMIARVAGKHMARVLGFTVMPVLLAPVLGPVIAGMILKHASWPWLFYLNLPVGVAGVVMAKLLLPDDHALAQPRRFDLTGFMLLSPGLACVLFGLPQLAHGQGGWTLAIGAALMLGFVWNALREKGDTGAALIDLRLFANRTFASAAITQFFSNGVFYARQFLVPLYLIVGCTMPAAQVGSMMAAMGVGMMCSFPLVGYLTGRFGCRAVSSGGALLASLAMLPFLWMIQFHIEPMLAVACLFFAGAGQGTISIPSVSAAYAAVPKEKIADANTALNIVQRLGGPLVTTILATIMSMSTMNPKPVAHDFMAAFGMMLVLHGLVFLAASRLPAQIHRPEN